MNRFGQWTGRRNSRDRCVQRMCSEDVFGGCDRRIRSKDGFKRSIQTTGQFEGRISSDDGCV